FGGSQLPAGLSLGPGRIVFFAFAAQHGALELSTGGRGAPGRLAALAAGPVPDSHDAGHPADLARALGRRPLGRLPPDAHVPSSGLVPVRGRPGLLRGPLPFAKSNLFHLPDRPAPAHRARGWPRAGRALSSRHRPARSTAGHARGNPLAADGAADLRVAGANPLEAAPGAE